MTDDEEVPPHIRLLRDFINTREPQVGDDELEGPADLRDWLAARQLVPGNAQLTSADLQAAVVVREGFRAVLMGHAGHDVDGDAVRLLNQTFAERPVRLVFADSGYSLAGETGSPFDLALGRLADSVRQSSEDGSWRRLKVCARDTCRWAFFDGSRNQVRRWCSMAGCGNYVKMRRAYAARKVRAGAPPTEPAHQPDGPSLT